MRERGRSDTMAQTIEMVEKFLCRDGVTAQRREALLALYDALIEAEHRFPWTTL